MRRALLALLVLLCVAADTVLDPLVVAVHRTIVEQTPRWCERELESPDERSERLWPAAVALVAATRDRRKLAAGIAVAQLESGFARYAQYDCQDRPRGCSGDCDRDKHGEVRARSPWQLWRKGCPALWQLDPGSPEALSAGAACAVRLFGSARARCAGLAKDIDAGAFAGYGGRSCDNPGFGKRAARYRAILVQLEREIWREQEKGKNRGN